MCSIQPCLLLPELRVELMLTREHKIRLVREFRNALLNPWFDELYRKSPSSPAKQASDDIVATAEIIFAFLTRCAEI